MILRVHKTVLMASLAALVGAMASTALFLEQHQQQEAPQPTASITLAMTTNPDSTLIMVAERLGYFRDEGLEVRTLHYRSGKDALGAMLQGKAQLATSAETPIVLNILNGKDPVIIAGIFNSDRNMAVISRRDRSIKTLGDLQGKRIGVTLGTNGDYFLHAILAVEGIPDSRINIIDMPPQDMAKAMADNSLDAVCTWQPFIADMQIQLGDKAISFFGGDIYTYTFNVSATREFIARHPEIITAFLQALEKSERFVLDNPGKARQIVADTSHWDINLLDKIWGDFTFQLSLDPALIMVMENEARWAIATGRAHPQEMPDALNYIYLAGLQAVAPCDVTILR